MSRCARRARSLSEGFRTLDSRLRIGLAVGKGYRERGVAPDGTAAMTLGFSAAAGEVVARLLESLRAIHCHHPPPQAVG
jgi:hypothetical protein